MPELSSPSKTYSINLQPVGRRAEVTSDQSLLTAAQASGVELVSLCGGVGACDSCKVRLVSGKLSPLTLEEEALFSIGEQTAGYRLACQAKPLSDVVIDIPPESLTTPQRLQVEGIEVEIQLEPLVKPIDLQLDPPALHDLRSDTTRVTDAINQTNLAGSNDGPCTRLPRFHHAVLSTLSSKVRHLEWLMRLAVRENEVIAVLPPTDPAGKATSLLGLAVDVGTTKVAAYLLDLSTGKTIAKTGAMNPQIAFGEDVVSRIAYANANNDGAKVLQSRLVETLNQMVQELCSQAAQEGATAASEMIVDAVVVGNTVMHHLFAGLPVAQLGAAPYVPAVSEALDISAREVGLAIAPGAYIHLPPNIAGYVGADHVAMLLATGVEQKKEKTVVALDIGTNTEITLAHKGRMVSCSCASGPAFEGAHIHDGMRAAPGAVERVQINGNEVRIHTIGNQPAVGICGSGILDAVGEMIAAGIVDPRGAIRKIHPAIRTSSGMSELVLAPAEQAGHGRDVVVTRKDVNEIQLAKGAIRAGVEILLEEVGLQGNGLAIDEFIVAGAFGTYISIENAVRIGMFPDLPLERFQQVGNAAGTGARQMLVSAERRRMAQEIVGELDYVELSAHPDFINEFSHDLFFYKAE
jgi:uncharacterized 2Fe-2S/4Fe-4S cluster protein (DUF4445 family)